MQAWNVLHAARWKSRTQKNRHFGTIAQLCQAISSELRHVSTIGKKLLNSNIFSTCSGHDMTYSVLKVPFNSNQPSTCSDNMVNFCLLTIETCWQVCGTPANFIGFRVLAVLLHGTLVVGVSQTLRRWTQGATYIQQGGHHVGHWPKF